MYRTMGWQSYLIFFETPDEKERIISAIKEHNNEQDGANWELVGETLIMIQERKVLSKPHFVKTKGRSVILFGNGGGRSCTFKYFEDKGFEIIPYSHDWDEKLNPHEEGITISGDGMTW